MDNCKECEQECCGNCNNFSKKTIEGDGYCKAYDEHHNKEEWCDSWDSVNKDNFCNICNNKINPDEVCESCYAESCAFKNDEVNHPKHYTQLPIECKDVIKYFDAPRGQAIKYIWRCEDKGKPIQDLRKAIFWLEEKIKMYESEGKNE